MKNTRKLMAILMAAAMLFALSVTALAATSTHTIQITGTAASPTAGHTYTVYQIFTGELAEIDGEEILTEVVYGMNYTPGESKIGDPVADADLDAITDANAFASKLVEENLLEGTYNTLNAANNWKLENVVSGYYLIVDTTDPLPEYHTRSAYIVQVVDDVDMAPKSSVVEFEKKVQDINDSEGVPSDWQDSADYDIGDSFPYQIVASFTDIAEFEDYEISIVDTMSKGLTYNDDAVITITYKVEGSDETYTKTVTDFFQIASADCQDTEGKYVDGTVITLTNADIKAIATEGNMISATVTVDYTSTLNSDALIGSAGNPNKAYLIFDREPDSEGKGQTPEDVNIVFTFKSIVNKVDEDMQPLTGAEFKLEKFIADENGNETFEETKGYWKTLEYVKNDEGTVFSFEGLDDGEYRVTETAAPAGYNKIPAFYFTVTADHEIEAADPKLLDLDCDGGDVVTFEVDPVEGSIENDVVNKKGAILPETGGIGTIIFYVAGALLVVAAIVVLVTRKRMSKVEK